MGNIEEKKERSETLKELIVQLRLRLARVLIPSGDCPYMYYSLKNRTKADIDCGEFDCWFCEKRFFEDYERELRESEDAKTPNHIDFVQI